MVKEIAYLDRNISFDPETVSPAPLDEQRYPAVSSLAIDVTGYCNLKCTYCAESCTMPRRQAITRETLNKALQALFNWSHPKIAVSIHLGSGEPLLKPDVVEEIGKKATQIAGKQHRFLSLYLTTNGTHLNEQIIKWLIDDHWNVKISLDGDQTTQDMNRKYKNGKGTYKQVSSAIITLAKKIPEKLSTTSVLCNGTDPSKVFYHIGSLGVKRIEMVPVAASGESSLRLGKNDLDMYRRYIESYTQKLADGLTVPTNIRFHNRVLRVLGYKNTRTSCGAGRTFFACGNSGQIYPCFRFIGIERYKLGDLNGLEMKFARAFINTSGRPYELRVTCRACWAAPLCGGPCFACAEMFGGGLPLPEYCEIVQAEAKAAIWLVDFLKQRDSNRLIKLLGVGFL